MKVKPETFSPSREAVLLEMTSQGQYYFNFSRLLYVLAWRIVDWVIHDFGKRTDLLLDFYFCQISRYLISRLSSGRSWSSSRTLSTLVSRTNTPFFSRLDQSYFHITAPAHLRAYLLRTVDIRFDRALLMRTAWFMKFDLFIYSSMESDDLVDHYTYAALNKMCCLFLARTTYTNLLTTHVLIGCSYANHK